MNPQNRKPTPPGEVLAAEFIEPLGLTRKAFAERAEMSVDELNRLISGDDPVDYDIALALAQATGMSAEFWMSLQSAWDQRNKP